MMRSLSHPIAFELTNAQRDWWFSANAWQDALVMYAIVLQELSFFIWLALENARTEDAQEALKL